MDFPRKLKRLCAERDLTQRKLSALAYRDGVDVSKSKVNNWFNGKSDPSLTESRWLADCLGVSIDYLGKPDIEEPTHAIMNDDERRVIKLFRLLGIGADEAMRRLTTNTRAEAGPQVQKQDIPEGTFISGLMSGQPKPQRKEKGAP